MNYIKISDAVDELSVARRDNDRTEYLRYLILAKTVLKDLKIRFLNDFKRVYLAVNPETNTVRLPFDYQRFRTLSIIENCHDAYGRPSEKVIPLTFNPYINITPQETVTCDNTCNCEINHPICQELADYEVIEEEITIDEETTGTRQTILRTCANGDIVKEVSEPVQKWIEGDQQCDYEIAIEKYQQTLCNYTLDFIDIDPSFPLVINMTLNGVAITSGSLSSIGEMDDFFESYGWTKISTENYEIENSTETWGAEVELISGLETNIATIESDCVNTSSFSFPFTIVSYVLNGVTITTSPVEVISNQDDLDAFFVSLGFEKVDDTHYTKEDSEDVYFSILIEYGQSPTEEATINFTQSNCRRPLIAAGYENQMTSDVLCNVTLKECGCIAESSSNISTLASCCAPYLQCCQQGQLNNYAGWGYVPSCCPTNSEQPFNRFGTYRLDEKNYLIYLDSVNATKLLLAYDNDGSCENEYVIPDYCMDAMKGGIAFYAAQYDEEVNPFRRRELEINYSKMLRKLSTTYTDPIRMSDLINVLKTKKYPY